MPLQVYVAHTGDTLDIDPTYAVSIDDLKSYLEQATQIPSDEQILLTLRGKHVKQAAFSSENAFYVYDRRFFNSSPESSPLIPPTPPPEPYTPESPPDQLGNQTHLKSWQNLFKARSDWALSLVDHCRSMSVTAQHYFSAQAIVEQGVRVATTNHDSHIKKLQNKYAEARAWMDEATKDQHAVTGSWESDLARLQSVQVKEGFRDYINGQPTTPRKESKRNVMTTLDSFLDYDAVVKAAAKSEEAVQEFSHGAQELGARVDKVVADYAELMTAVGQSQSRSFEADRNEPARLIGEIEMIVDKVARDYDHVLTLRNEPKSVSSASKTAVNHTRNFLPNLRELALEMNDLVQRAIEQRNAAVSLALEHMQTITAIEQELTRTSKDVDTLEVGSEGIEALDTLTLVANLPFVCGELLVEAVRRDEWVDKMKHDSSALAEEVAGYQEEEQKRRRKWLKNMGDLVNRDGLDGKPLGVEINLQGETSGMPRASREDLETYLNSLRALEGMEQVVAELEGDAKELDKPTRQQVKRIKAFKNGSIHDAGLGKGSLLLRGDDELRVLREANARLEDDLKGSKSRIRKLEDLLHRSKDTTRFSSITGFSSQTSATPERFATPPPASIPSPRPQDELSRRPSISRRFSATKEGEEKALARRMLKLEQDLTQERETRTKLEAEMQSRDQTIQDAQATKTNLMENMKAQQQELAHERTLLNEELAKYKVKVDELEDANTKLEDELDRLIGSRDHERTGIEDKMHSLMGDLDSIRREAADDVRKAEEQAKELEEQHQAENQQLISQLSALHVLLGPIASEASEGGIATLIASIEQLTVRSQDHVKELESAIAIVKAENGSLQQANEMSQADLDALREQLGDTQANFEQLQDSHAAAEAKVVSLEAELEDEQRHLTDLRSKFAEGETGSESLRQRVAEEEAKATQLVTELAETKAHAEALDNELSKARQQYQELESRTASNSQRLSNRSLQAKELAQKLFAQNERLGRLLETLGFAITHQDDIMVVQRASKTNASLLMDSTNPLQRSLSTPPPGSKKASVDHVDLALLHWMDAPDTQKESQQYAELVSTLDRFRLDTFSDAISKRMRDIEYTALKWKKQVKEYRDKAHRSQSEAHDKLAIRGFKEGDLALFLPTRNQVARPWAAFNIGAPHYFLREQDSHRLQSKEWLVARITRIEERVVNLSQDSGMQAASDKASIGGSSDGASYNDDNPFQLSDGLRWYLLDAYEEKAGAPTTPILGKATVGNIDKGIVAKADMGGKKSSEGVTKTLLHKSLESRRSSTTSKKSLPIGKASSNEALVPDAAESSLDRKRAPSQASSFRPKSVIEPQEEDGVSGTARQQLQRAASFRSAASSQAVQSVSGASTPGKQPPKVKAPGLWQSLWQLDVNY